MQSHMGGYTVRSAASEGHNVEKKTPVSLKYRIEEST